MNIEDQKAVVLIVEDDVFMQKTIEKVIEQLGVTVLLAADAREAREAIKHASPHIVILDINLPDELGFSLAREIHDRHNAGIIILTSRDSEADRLLGLELGADEYLTKPFNPRELNIRVSNMLNRIDGWSQRPAGHDAVVDFGDWSFHPEQRLLSNKYGHSQNLTRMESDVLTVLTARPNHIFRRQELVASFKGGGNEKSIRAVDNIIMRLRKKMGQTIKSKGHIETVSGQGYCFRPVFDEVD